MVKRCLTALVGQCGGWRETVKWLGDGEVAVFQVAIAQNTHLVTLAP